MKRERITKPIDEDNFGGLSEIEVTRKLFEAYNKLVKIEDIEDKFGIEFVTLFNILSEKECYDKEYGVCFVMGFGLSGFILMPKSFPYGECEFTRSIKDYGKTFARTKEELK